MLGRTNIQVEILAEREGRVISIDVLEPTVEELMQADTANVKIGCFGTR